MKTIVPFIYGAVTMFLVFAISLAVWAINDLNAGSPVPEANPAALVQMDDYVPFVDISDTHMVPENLLTYTGKYTDVYIYKKLYSCKEATEKGGHVWVDLSYCYRR